MSRKKESHALVDHLKRVTVDGQIQEGVFHGAWATHALTPDHLLLVVAPQLEGAPQLAEAVGVVDLKVLTKIVVAYGGDHIRVEDRHLVVGHVKLLTVDPRTIATTVARTVVDDLKLKVGADGGIPLPPALVAEVRRCWRDLKAEAVHLDIRGGMVRVGIQEHAHHAELPWPELRREPGYELRFGGHLIDVLSVVGDGAVLHLSGPGGVVAIENDGFTYLLSPRSMDAPAKSHCRRHQRRRGYAQQASALPLVSR